MASFRSFDSCAILEDSINDAGFLVPEAIAQICSVKKGVLRNFAKFTGKHLCQRVSFLIKFFKKETLTQHSSKTPLFKGGEWTFSKLAKKFFNKMRDRKKGWDNVIKVG